MAASFEEIEHESRRYTQLRRRGETNQSSPRRAYELLRASIREGLIEPNVTLLEHVLLRELGASRNAVRAALRMLADEGIVARESRSGTKVTRQFSAVAIDAMVPTEMLDRETSAYRIEKIYEGVVCAPHIVRSRFETNDDHVLIVEYIAVLSGEPLYLRTLYFPRPDDDRAFLDRVDQLIDLPVRFEESFERLHGTRLATVSGTFEAVPCEGRTAALLEVPPSVPILLQEHVMRDTTGIVREISYTHYRGDRSAVTSVWMADHA